MDKCLQTIPHVTKMKYKLVFLLLTTYFIFGCSSNRDIVINNLIEEIQDFHKYSENEKLNIIYCNAKIDNNLFKYYLKIEEDCKKK